MDMEPILVGEFVVSPPPSILRGFRPSRRWDREQKSVMDESYRESLEKACNIIK